MAIEISGEVLILSPRPLAWMLLHEPDVLETCISGCDRLEIISATTSALNFVMRLGSVAVTIFASITGEGECSFDGFCLSGEGGVGQIRLAQGRARVDLTDTERGTLLRYRAELQVGGEPTEIDASPVADAIRKTAEDFFARLAHLAQRLRAEDADALGSHCRHDESRKSQALSETDRKRPPALRLWPTYQ
ncbi:CoxG family protein [Rhizobium lusitanum]|uniref:CoxG family protein n=1 Tax=Rhizobium lusitanum TaxID=293958 RepID=UPI0015742449|nr:SRPBCC domain-containing protein [Rhizobium lusitanum]NTJ11515.1 hypothetical protein [Rhizobium lusitanum]